ncbi:MAG: hypothetical protein ACKOCX_07435, partial [Planctomycetota bacterium]
MRLTLRTLLAWIDGVLPEPQQQELGAKVQASPVAPKLVARIEEVVGRPGLAAPRVDGRGLAEDPNTVAEYLDNVLPADRLEAFERVCIESDLHLAEAADCHGLLAELARDPASIPPLDRGLRKRLLARLAEDAAKLPREGAHAPLAPFAKGAADKGRRAAAASHGGREAAATDRRPRKKASLGAWLSAAVALLLLLSLAGLLGWSLLAGGKSAREVAVAKPAPDAPPAAAREPAPDAPPAAAPPVEPAPPALAAVVPPAAPPVAEPASAAITPPAAPPAVADALPAAAADGPPGGAEPGDAPPPPAAPAAAIAAVPRPQMEAADDEPSPDDPLPDEPAAPPAAAAPAPPPGIVAEGG